MCFKRWTLHSHQKLIFNLDLAEAKAFIKSLKPDVTDARVEEIFKKYDADNSGILQYISIREVSCQ